jgi:secreted trypsin-like serine protease
MSKKISLVMAAFAATFLAASGAALAVVNGEPDPSLARHAVMVLDDHGHMCTGAVIAPKSILTAAHCVTDGTDWRIFWRSPDDQPVFTKPYSVRVHPGYVRNTHDTQSRSIDLAIVTLEEPLPAPFAPIGLSDVTAVAPGDSISVAGFGFSEEKNRKTLGTMRRADLSVIEPFGHSSILVWLSDPSANGAGGCQGDSGGPLLYQGSLIAITFVTTGIGKRNCGVLTQGTLIAPQRDWILKTMER